MSGKIPFLNMFALLRSSGAVCDKTAQWLILSAAIDKSSRKAEITIEADEVPEDLLSEVERELMRNIPTDDVPNAHHWLLLHGRYVCKSGKPACATCPFDSFCPKRLANSKLRA